MDTPVDNRSVGEGAKEAVLTKLQEDTVVFFRDCMAKLHAEGRRVLDSNQLTDATEVVPHLELANDKLGSYLFSVNCKLGGEYLQGCLFAGELMQIAAPNLNVAKMIAEDGLNSTISLLYEEAITRPLRENEGVDLEVAGRKATEVQPLNGRIADTMTSILRNKTRH